MSKPFDADLRRTLQLGASMLLASALPFAAHAQKKYDTGASDTEIKLGNLNPYSGPASAYGTCGKAMQAYFDKINATGGVPFIAWQLIEHPDREKYDLSSIDAISYGGAPSAPELVSKIYEIFGAFPGNGWGMTETMATVTSHVAEDYLNRPDSCGPAVAVSDVKIMSEDGSTELPVGEVGELWARGPQIVKGYWNRPDATAETFVDGWVRTGDLARVDDEGFCFIVDRAKDMIIRGGENIYSSEVENILYEHPAVTDAALIGIPHQTLGEEPAAVVHLAPGMTASEDELREYVSARLAKFKVPVKIIFTQDTLPRNANGKILKRDLKALF